MEKRNRDEKMAGQLPPPPPPHSRGPPPPPPRPHSEPIDREKVLSLTFSSASYFFMVSIFFNLLLIFSCCFVCFCMQCRLALCCFGFSLRYVQLQFFVFYRLFFCKDFGDDSETEKLAVLEVWDRDVNIRIYWLRADVPFQLFTFTFNYFLWQIGAHHSEVEFAVRGNEPKDEVQIYTWKDAKLRELTDLVKEIAPEASRRNARLSFAFVNPDKHGRVVVKQVGMTNSHGNGRQVDESKSLNDLNFQIRDYLDVAIL
ncbi:unnamed protein product [Malus baccata var. baccata]